MAAYPGGTGNCGGVITVAAYPGGTGAGYGVGHQPFAGTGVVSEYASGRGV